MRKKQTYNKSVENLEYYENVDMLQRFAPLSIDELDYLIEVVKNDLKWTFLSYPYFKKQEFVNKAFNLHNFIPLSFVNLEGELKNYNKINEIINVDIVKTTTFVFPRERIRLRDVLKRKTEFKYDQYNHIGYYFNNFDLLIVSNGTHSIADGIVKRKQGKIDAGLIDTDEILKSVYVGEDNYFYNKYDNSKTYVKCFNYRIRLLFELVQHKYELLNNLPITNNRL